MQSPYFLNPTPYRGYTLQWILLSRHWLSIQQAKKAWRGRAEGERLKRLDAEKRRQELERQAHLEEKRLEFLRDQPDRRSRAVGVENFISEIDSADEDEGETADFLSWAKSCAAAVRAKISVGALTEKLSPLDLINDAADVNCLGEVGRALDPTQEREKPEYHYRPFRAGGRALVVLGEAIGAADLGQGADASRVGCDRTDERCWSPPVESI